MNSRFTTWALRLGMVAGVALVLLSPWWPIGLVVFFVSLSLVFIRGYLNTPNRGSDHTPWVQ